MSKSIELPDEIYGRLEQQAKARGLTVPQLIAHLEAEKERAQMVAAIEALRAKGVLLASAEPLQAPIPFKPIRVQGKPLSEVILKERR